MCVFVADRISACAHATQATGILCINILCSGKNVNLLKVKDTHSCEEENVAEYMNNTG
jgi:hypothetical protein